MSTARELTSHLALLLREEQGAMADFLFALADLDRKKLWRELGHTSLFYYLHRELRLSKGAAQNRKTAAELIQAFPEVEAALRTGKLCLSTVNEVARVLTPENRAEVLPRFFGLSRREAEALAVSLRPAEVVPSRDVIAAIPKGAPALRAATTQTALPAASPESGAFPVHPVCNRSWFTWMNRNRSWFTLNRSLPSCWLPPCRLRRHLANPWSRSTPSVPACTSPYPAAS